MKQAEIHVNRRKSNKITFFNSELRYKNHRMGVVSHILQIVDAPVCPVGDASALPIYEICDTTDN